jgi:hypothetical protein
MGKEKAQSSRDLEVAYKTKEKTAVAATFMLR